MAQQAVRVDRLGLTWTWFRLLRKVAFRERLADQRGEVQFGPMGRFVVALNDFKESSDRTGRRLIALTIALVALTLMLVVLTGVIVWLTTQLD